ncbi:hypothetical protein ASPVEDRAFT_775068 [Aspergillus versicolor CBS 583.65]|uniref:Uncharacterized protein n=1 Tax=Aspergillus versicolor CBS 583.65 TaxID=1036611 RepID=A0A1L9PRY0_ASPVE|nr:uncharacterized protein ASPVEDRAFT_775068 [Aspergillus versicolor CBS 583.65]OJJ04206.1 hypothetical protein ASPVEDRAFT_775068 [Aspergillus versicolor CBS 583.65]
MDSGDTNPGLRSYSQGQMIIFILWAAPLLSSGLHLPITVTMYELPPRWSDRSYMSACWDHPSGHHWCCRVWMRILRQVQITAPTEQTQLRDDPNKTRKAVK